jgi:hypothetical protein
MALVRTPWDRTRKVIGFSPLVDMVAKVYHGRGLSPRGEEMGLKVDEPCLTWPGVVVG